MTSLKTKLVNYKLAQDVVYRGIWDIEVVREGDVRIDCRMIYIGQEVDGLLHDVIILLYLDC